MRHCCLVLLTAVLVGLASLDTGLPSSAPSPSLTASAHAAALPGAALLPAGLPALGTQAPAVIVALLTLVLGLALGRMRWWVGLLLLGPPMIGLGAAAIITAAVPLGLLGPLLLAATSAYAVGLLGARSDRDLSRRDADDPALMPRLAVNSCAAIVTIDGEGMIRSCNPAAERMFGYPSCELAGLPFRRLLAGPEQDQPRMPVRWEGTTCPLTIRRRNGQCLAAGAALSTMEVDDGRVRVAVLVDATDLAAGAAARPLHDPVTGLPQRVLLADRIDQAVLAAERAGQPLAVLVLHLKLFKTLKDTLGDAFGDQLLVAMVDRLRESLRRSDTLARLSDAELSLLLPGPTDTAFATQVAQWVVQELARPIRVAALEIALEASVGLAIYPHHGRRTQELLQRAEIAMLAARSTRRAVAIYPPPAERPSREEQTLVDDLREAIEEGQLFLEFLPKLNLRTDQPDGVEALVRWRHPERGIVPAARFAAIAAEHDLMLPMTLRVLSLAIGHQRAWHAHGIEFTVAINLSSDCLYNPQLMEITDQLLRTAGGRPEALVFEITENMLAQDPSRILDILKGLAAKGYQLALDDFGTGSLSLSVLQKLPVTELKIDRSFVTGMIHDQDAAAVVRSALSLGQSLGLRVVAEGVEDQPTLDRLRSWGCTHAQGFFIGTPMAADDFEQWQKSFDPGVPPANNQPSAAD